VVRMVKGTSTAPSVHVCTTVVLIVKGKTGKEMDTWTQGGVQETRLLSYVYI
jgi:hypothetical protein